MGKFLYQIFRIFWTIWAGIAFLVAMLFLFPVLVIGVTVGGEKTRLKLHGIPRLTSKILFVLVMIRRKFQNPFPLAKTDQYICISNHNSNLDPFITAASIPGIFKFLSKAEVLDLPFFGYAVRNLYVSVKREEKNDRARSMNMMRDFLDEGASLILYPEGTRNRTDAELGPFKMGAFRLSIEKNVPIVVLLALNSWKRMPPDKPWISPGMLHCKWIGPFYPEGYDLNKVEEYAEMVRNEMLKGLEGWPQHPAT